MTVEAPKPARRNLDSRADPCARGQGDRVKTRREMLIAFALSAFVAPVAALAQQKGKVWRIGILRAGAAAAASHQLEVFQAALRDLGYVEGRNLLIEHRQADGKYEQLADLAAELVRSKVDLILSTGTSATRAAQQATGTVPIVMASEADDPVASGLVSSLARPGRNITGLTSFARGLSSKRLELLREMFPRGSRVAVLLNLNNPRHQSTLKEIELAAAPLGISLQPLAVRNPSDIESAIQAAAKGRVDALMLPTDALFSSHAQRIAQLAIDNRLPMTYDRDDFVEAGGLMSYGVEQDDLYRRAAHYVDKILKGTKPANLPIEQPTKFELVVNLKTAKALGLTIPQSILVRADRVIE